MESEKQAAGQDSAASNIRTSSGSDDMKTKSYPCGWSTPTKTTASQMPKNLQLFTQTRNHTSAKFCPDLP